jgi:bifunctional non-homologous end joining protein LigD
VKRELVDVEGVTLSLSNLDKVLYPAVGFTKGDVIAYYAAIAPMMLPHLVDRPVTFLRSPDGVDEAPFFQKHVPPKAPAWLRRITVPRSERREKEGTIEYPGIDNLAGLVWAANLAALEFNVPLWRSQKAGEFGPFDSMVFDLDPGPPATVVECARVVPYLLEELSARGHDLVRPKTSGSKGLHVHVPLDPPRPAADVREEARTIARALERSQGDLVVATMRKEDRTGKVFIDWSQNSPTKTTVAAYSLRPRRLPTVSTPVTLEEVDACARKGDPELLQFLTEDVLERTRELGDLFAA